MPINDDEMRNERFATRTIATSLGREVTVGHAHASDSVVLRFKNNQGTVTAFGLSGESFDALRQLIAIPREQFVAAPVELVWRFVVDCLIEKGAATIKDEGGSA